MTERGNIQDLVARAESVVAGIEGPAEREAAMKRVLASLLRASNVDDESARGGWSPATLQQLALEHTVLMWAFAAALLLALVREFVPAWRGSAMTLSGFAMCIAMSLLLFSISKRLYGMTVAIALALVALVPVVGYVVLLVVDRKAMNILMRNGFVVGLIRARPRAASAND